MTNHERYTELAENFLDTFLNIIDFGFHFTKYVGNK